MYYPDTKGCVMKKFSTVDSAFKYISKDLSRIEFKKIEWHDEFMNRDLSVNYISEEMSSIFYSVLCSREVFLELNRRFRDSRFDVFFIRNYDIRLSHYVVIQWLRGNSGALHVYRTEVPFAKRVIGYNVQGFMCDDGSYRMGLRINITGVIVNNNQKRFIRINQPRKNQIGVRYTGNEPDFFTFELPKKFNLSYHHLIKNEYRLSTYSPRELYSLLKGLLYKKIEE